MNVPLNILLIEDNEDDVLLEIREIKRHFSEVTWEHVYKREDVLAQIDSGDWSLILCDYMLPDLTPAEVLEALQERELDIPVIVISGRVDEETIVALMKAGAVDYILKDNLTRLAPAIEREVIEARHRKARLQAEISLRENRRFLSSLLQTLPGVVYRCDMDEAWTMRYLSQSCLEVTGYDPYQLINNKKLSFADLIHPEDRDHVWNDIKRDVEAHRPYQTRYRIITASGDVRWMMDHGRALSLQAGEPDILEGYIFDVTDAKRTELELEESRLRFRSISDASHDAIIMINDSSQVVYWNRAAEKMFGYTDKEILGRNVSQYILPEHEAKDHHQRISMFAEDRLREVTGRTLELIAKRKSGDHFPIELSLSTVVLNDRWHAVASIRDITERQRTMTALLESEEKFRRLVEESVEGICLIRGRRLLFINHRFQTMFGYDEYELLDPSFSVLTLIDHEDRSIEDLIRERFRSRSLDKEIISFAGVCKDGRRLALDVSLAEVRFSGEQALLAILRDTTEQKQAEEALRESEQRFRLLAENAQDVIFRFALHPVRHYEYISPAVELVSGYKPEEFYRDPELALKIIHPDDRDTYISKLQQSANTDELVRLRWISRRGHIIWAEQRNVQVHDDDGNLIAVEGIIRDVTKQRHADERLRVFSDVIEKSPSSIIITDTKGSIQYVNQSFTKVTGYSQEEVIGKNPNLLKSGKHSPKFYQDLWQTVLAGNVWQGELTNRRKNGELYTESAIISPISDHLGTITHLVALKLDMSEQKRLIADRERLEGELARQFHLSQVGLLASGIAHNLRSPLSVILMYIEMMRNSLEGVLQDPPRDAATLFEHLENIDGKTAKVHDAAQRIDRIIDDITSYQRMNQTLTSEVVDINKLLSADAAILQADLDLKHKVTTKLELSPHPLWCALKASDISQIFLNLISNARDAMMDSSKRMLTVRSGEGDDNTVWFEVHDTGNGIPQEYIDRIREPFFTTKSNDKKALERGSGTGLGLYMIQRQLEQNGGYMEVTSVPGDTTFRIIVPQANAPKLAENI